MIDIFVSRGLGDKRGPDIVEPLLTSLAPALTRGQVEIDRNSPKRTVQVVAKFGVDYKTGQIVEVVDALQGEAWRGKIASIDTAISGTKLNMHLTVERPT